MIETLQRLGRHGEWADARLLAAARQAHGGLATVLKELAHIRGAQETWISRIAGRPATLAVWPHLGFSELATAGVRLDAEMRALLLSLTPAALAEDVAYTTTSGVAFRTRLGDILLQLLTHGQYHRGKANAALRAIGAEAINVDFVTWLREVDAASAS